MKKIVFLVIIISCPDWLWGQVNSCPEQFKAYNSQGQEETQFCVGQLIRFKSCLPNTQPDKEYYDFDKSNGVSFSTDTTKRITYNRAGTYTITQLINTGQISQKERTFMVVDTPPPVFTLTACAQNLVRVTITDTKYQNFKVDFGDGITQNLNRGGTTTHQYTAGPPFKVVVTATYTGATCSGQAEQTIQALPAPASPILESVRIITPGLTGTLLINIKNLQPEYYYILERVAGTSGSLIDTLKNPVNPTVNYTIANINTNIPVCFRLRTTDRCGTNLNSAQDNICSQPLTVAPANNQVVLSWPLYPENSNLKNYLLYRNGTLLKTLPANTAAYTDANVVCGSNYCYQLTANLNNNSSTLSNEICTTVTVTNVPPPGRLISTFTSDNQIKLFFTLPNNQPKIITYQKSENNGPYTTLAVNNQTTLTDNTKYNEIAVCYQAFYEDYCGRTSAPTNYTCPVILSHNTDPNNTINFTWTPYQGFSGPVQYNLEQLTADGSVINSTLVTGTTYQLKINNPDQQQFYRIKVFTATASEVSFSNTVVIRQESKFIIPTAFSPNGDGLNDLFEIKGNIFGNYRLQIINRWGQIIFESINPQLGWNGTIKGQDAPVGVYVYAVSASDSRGGLITKTGTVTLVR